MLDFLRTVIEEEKIVKNIIDQVEEAGNYRVLLRALFESGMDVTLSARGPYTVFAPSDQAFNEMSKDQINNLMKDRQQLTKFVANHVISGYISPEQALQIGTAITMAGQKISFENKNGLSVNGAKVVNSVRCDNGQILTIDKIILPK